MKKKLAIFLIIILTMSTMVTSVSADGKGSNVGSVPGAPSPQCKGTNTMCYDTSHALSSGNAKRISGVRASVVDSKGNKVSNIVDFVSNPEFLTNPQPFKETSLNISNKVLIASEKHIRNEVLQNSDISKKWVSPSDVKVYYWPGFPDYSETVDSQSASDLSIRNYVLGLYTKQNDQFKALFDLLGYDPYEKTETQEGEITTVKTGSKDTYLLLEPLSYLSLEYKTPEASSYLRYFGTITEIYAMVTHSNFDVKGAPDKLYYGAPGTNGTISQWLDSWAGSIIVGTRTQNDANYNYTAGLWSIYSGDASCGKSIILNKSSVPYQTSDGKSGNVTGGCGYASGHWWVYDLITDTPPPGGDPESCKEPMTSLPASCQVGSEGYAYDPENWKCIYDQRDATRNTFEGQYYNNVISKGKSGNAKISANPYCTVACREDIRYYLPSTGFEINSGYFFTIGKGDSNANFTVLTPVTFVGKSECQTGYRRDLDLTKQKGDYSDAVINVKKFLEDYEGADTKVSEKWDEYELARLEKQVVDIVNKHDAEYKTGSDSVLCPVEKYYSELYHCKNNVYEEDDCILKRKSQPDAVCGEPLNDTGNPNYPWTVCKGETKKEDETVNYDIYEYSASYKGATMENSVKISKSYQSDSCKGEIKAKTERSINDTYEKYKTAVAARENVLNQLLQCNNFQRLYDEFEPVVSFTYKDALYSYSKSLSSSLSVTYKTEYYTGNLSKPKSEGTVTWSNTDVYDTIDDNFIYYKNVNGAHTTYAQYICEEGENHEIQKCSKAKGDKQVTYPTNTFIRQETVKTYNYELQPETYTYIRKRDGRSFSASSSTIKNHLADATKKGQTYIINKKEYYHITYSVLPVSQSTPAGTYDYYFSFAYGANGKTQNLFGKNQKYLKYNKVDLGTAFIANGMSMTSNTSYVCKYEVKERDFCVTCCPGDKDYPNCKICPCGKYEDGTCRPCKDGNGDITVIYRPISLNDPFPDINGKGRKSGANWQGMYNNNTSIIKKYITNNRGVTTDQVYTLTPMYEFVLGPTNILKIRRYNENHKSDYNDFNLNCTDNQYCKSNFLKDGIEKKYFSFTSANNTGGVCFNATKKTWESCRYPKQEG